MRRALAGPGSVEGQVSFETFFRDHRGHLFATLYLVMGRMDEAEDVMQEAFVRVWERWESVRDHADPAGYLYRTAFNVSRDRARRVRTAARALLWMSPAHDAFASVDERVEILDALRHLSRRQRSALVLTELLDFTSGEAAAILGIRAVTVRALASQGRAALRRALGEADV